MGVRSGSAFKVDGHENKKGRWGIGEHVLKGPLLGLKDSY